MEIFFVIRAPIPIRQHFKRHKYKYLVADKDRPGWVARLMIVGRPSTITLPLSMMDEVLVHVSTQIKQRIDR